MKTTTKAGRKDGMSASAYFDRNFNCWMIAIYMRGQCYAASKTSLPTERECREYADAFNTGRVS